MALHTQKGNYEIPKDAVPLSEEGAINFMQTIVKSWKIPGDTFYLKYGPLILGALSAVTASYTHNYYRHRFRLMSYGRLSSYLPVVVVPAFATVLIQTRKVQEPILIEKYSCPLCMEIRACSFQFVTGVVYPMCLAPLAGLLMATRYNTYNVPYITQDPKAVMKLILKFTKPMKTTLGIIAGLNLLAASFVVYKENSNVLTIKQKLMQMEESHQQT